MDELVASGRSRGFAAFSEGNGKQVEVDSTFPPDSSIAWPAIYTGVNPYKLQLYDHSGRLRAYNVHDRLIGRTFWDYASKRDLSCCIINPIPIFPSWQVKGTMITGLTGSDVISAIPKSREETYRIPRMKYPRPPGVPSYPVLPGEHLRYYNTISEDSLDLSRFCIKMLTDRDYDLFFACFTTLDYAQHILWRFSDPSDPTNPKINPLRGYLMRFYELFDGIVKKFLNEFGSEYTIAILSDHGNGRRPWKLFSLNELLRRSGLIEPPDLTKLQQIRSYLTCLAYQFACYSRTDLFAYRAYSVVKRRRMSMALANLSPTTSTAAAGEFGKQYGSITINESSAQKREQLTGRLLNYVGSLEVVERAVRTRDVYGVTDDVSQPEIIVKLKDEYGFQHGCFAPLMQRNFERRIVSGGHFPRTRLMLWEGPNKTRLNPGTTFQLVDVTPSILEHLDVPIPGNMEGKGIWRCIS